MTSSTIRISSIAVMSSQVSIETDAYADVPCLECIKCFLIQKRAVGLHPCINMDARVNGIADLIECIDHQICPSKEGLAAMEDYSYRIEIMDTSVFGDPHSHDRDERARHRLRPTAP